MDDLKEKIVDTLKSILGHVLLFAFVCLMCVTYGNTLGNWTFRYKSLFNNFFGKGNWEVVSRELDGPANGKYTYDIFKISYKTKDGKEEICEVSNNEFKLSEEIPKNFFGTKNLTNKEAINLEFLYVVTDKLEEEIFNEIIRDTLSENEAKCIEVDLLFERGYDIYSYYGKLHKKEWFTINNATVEDFLSDSKLNADIKISLDTYALEELTKEERKNVIDSSKIIEDKLRERYGNDFDIRIYR